MFEKVRGWLKKSLGTVKKRLNQFQQPIKWIVIGYLDVYPKNWTHIN